MKNSILFLTFLNCWVLGVPVQVPADQVSKHAVILKDVRDLKDANGVLIAQESIFGGGLSNDTSQRHPNARAHGVTLTELRSPHGGFESSMGQLGVTVKTIPLVVAKNPSGVWYPALGRWDFKTDNDNSYESVVHVQKGGDLDIVFQSTGMRIGNQRNVVHYGLSGNPHAISLSRKRLKAAITLPKPSTGERPILNYQPPDDVILVQMNLSPKGLLIQPIFDYQVEQ